MLNKKAQMMSFLLVFITAFMCLTALGVYSVQIKNLKTSIISPAIIQEKEDTFTLLEIQEREMLINSIGALTWDEEDFKQTVEDNFLKKLEKRPEMISTLVNNLKDSEDKITPAESETTVKKVHYIKHNIYNLDYNGKEIILKRNLIKKYNLVAKDPKKISFSMDMTLPFESTIIVSEEDVKFLKENTEQDSSEEDTNQNP
jgi:hypothetical protein